MLAWYASKLMVLRCSTMEDASPCAVALLSMAMAAEWRIVEEQLRTENKIAHEARQYAIDEVIQLAAAVSSATSQAGIQKTVRSPDFTR